MNYIDDEYMTYDLNNHRYTLTVDGYEKISGEALTADHGLSYEQASNMLKRVSTIIYTYIYTWARDKDRTEYEISLPKYRDGLRDAMVEMMTAILANKTDPTLYFKNRKFTEVVSPGVRMIMYNNGLLFRGRWPLIDKDYKTKKGTEY